jgi:hypothetical protein
MKRERRIDKRNVFFIPNTSALKNPHHAVRKMGFGERIILKFQQILDNFTVFVNGF